MLVKQPEISMFKVVNRSFKGGWTSLKEMPGAQSKSCLTGFPAPRQEHSREDELETREELLSMHLPDLNSYL